VRSGTVTSPGCRSIFIPKSRVQDSEAQWIVSEDGNVDAYRCLHDDRRGFSVTSLFSIFNRMGTHGDNTRPCADEGEVEVPQKLRKLVQGAYPLLSYFKFFVETEGSQQQTESKISSDGGLVVSFKPKVPQNRRTCFTPRIPLTRSLPRVATGPCEGTNVPIMGQIRVAWYVLGLSFKSRTTDAGRAGGSMTSEETRRPQKRRPLQVTGVMTEDGMECCECPALVGSIQFRLFRGDEQ